MNFHLCNVLAPIHIWCLWQSSHSSVAEWSQGRSCGRNWRHWWVKCKSHRTN